MLLQHHPSITTVLWGPVWPPKQCPSPTTCNITGIKGIPQLDHRPWEVVTERSVIRSEVIKSQGHNVAPYMVKLQICCYIILIPLFLSLSIHTQMLFLLQLCSHKKLGRYDIANGISTRSCPNKLFHLPFQSVSIVHRDNALVSAVVSCVHTAYFWVIAPSDLIMVALQNRADHYIFMLWFVLCSFFFFSSPNLDRRRLDVCHTFTHGVALVRS